MYSLLYFVDRVKESFLLRYRKYVFLHRINSTEKSVRILGSVSVARCKSLQIGKDVTIYPNVSFNGTGAIIIGDNVQIGEGTIIYAHQRVVIGDNVAIAGQCYIIDCNHDIERDTLIQKQPLVYDESGIFIGSDVRIAAGCKIIKGAKINDGAVIGAMSLVNSEIEANGIAVGIPAKIKKYR
ncbi:acyltransferase [Pedobacter sp. Hv1]|uniref:acyltransferase n=1 Tax=Pedobacter sp. Hv1 TaxID=1740090 RepID=UPI0006D8C824|nr:acyltransferase [Pedobacter sp. Hv1]KQB99627.1 hypothetical protein AQF98_18935 [Pedobacter sp. Hv1]